MVYVLVSVHLYALRACLLCACAQVLALGGDTAHTLMMEIIRNFLQLGRWWWVFFFWRGAQRPGWVGCEWVRKRGEVRMKESVSEWVGR